MEDQKEQTYLDTIECLSATLEVREARLAKLEEERLINKAKANEKYKNRRQAPGFCKLYQSACRQLTAELKTHEYALVFVLISRVQMKTNVVLNDSEKPASITDIARIARKDRAQITKTLAVLESKGIIKKHQTKVKGKCYYTVNGAYCLKGEKLTGVV